MWDLVREIVTQQITVREANAVNRAANDMLRRFKKIYGV